MALSGRDWLTARGQAQAVKLQAQALARLDVARYYGALVELASQPSFDIVLTHWIAAVLMAPCKTPEDMGKQHFVLQVLQDLRNAVEGRTMAPQETFHYEFALGGESHAAVEEPSEADHY